MPGPRDAVRILGSFRQIDFRVIVVKLNGRPFDATIMQIFSPTISSRDEEIKAFYADVDKPLAQCKSQEIVFVMGDMNAKVWCGNNLTLLGHMVWVKEMNEGTCGCSGVRRMNKLSLAHTLHTIQDVYGHRKPRWPHREPD